MKNRIVAFFSAMVLATFLAGCAGGGTYVKNRQIGAGVGAVSGGAIGAAVSRGNPAAIIGGAAVGGVAGYYIGKSTERRHN